MSTLSDTTLADYGHPVFQRDGYVCVYCGFDGNGFLQWRQLCVGWLRPKSAGGADSADNLVTACNFCDSVAGGMPVVAGQSDREILQAKREYIRERSKALYRHWSSKVGPQHTALAPETDGSWLPQALVLDLSSLELTDRQLIKISSDNDILQLELTAKGELVIMPPTRTISGWKEGRLLFRVAAWAEEDGTGVTFGLSGGFRLPNKAVRAPDAAWIPRERWEEWLQTQDGEDDEAFANFCPDFVLELRSRSETLASQQRKMEEYLKNGARLGWLVDDIQKRVHIYRPNQPPEVLEDPEIVSGEAVLPGFELKVREIW